MADNETTADVIAWLRRPREGENAYLTAWRDEIADRFEAAWKRERESITPKPDPDWKDICAKCQYGDIEPKHCEYYGEPNGCNSPIYGEHPTAEKSSEVGDTSKLREALLASRDFIDRVLMFLHGMETIFPGENEIIDRIRSALGETPKMANDPRSHIYKI